MGLIPGIKSGRWWKLDGVGKTLEFAPLVSLEFTIGTGRPLCAVTIAFNCHPSLKRFGPPNAGKAYVNAAVNRCRVSKFDGPYSAARLFESCGKATVAKLKSMPSEASSSDFDNVYPVNPENPCQSRVRSVAWNAL